MRDYTKKERQQIINAWQAVVHEASVSNHTTENMVKEMWRIERRESKSIVDCAAVLISSMCNTRWKSFADLQGIRPGCVFARIQAAEWKRQMRGKMHSEFSINRRKRLRQLFKQLRAAAKITDFDVYQD
jgi:hypothetical protein